MKEINYIITTDLEKNMVTAIWADVVFVNHVVEDCDEKTQMAGLK